VDAVPKSMNTKEERMEKIIASLSPRALARTQHNEQLNYGTAGAPNHHPDVSNLWVCQSSIYHVTDLSLMDLAPIW
jgi:hypothetical protein